MQDFVFHVPGNLVVGTETVARVGSYASSFGSRILLVSEETVRETGHLARVKQHLERAGLTVIVFDEIDAGSDSSVVERALGLARASHSEVIVGLGGMRTLAAARVVAAYAKRTRNFREILSLGPDTPSLGYIEVPTTGRNHAMLGDECVVTEAATRQPLTIKLPSDLLSTAIIDARLASGIAKKSYCAILMDTILASIEGILSTKANELSDTLLVQAVTLLRQSIEQVLAAPTDLRPRVRATEAMFMSALGLSISSRGIGGAVSYAVSSRYEIPKSWVSTVVLPYLLDYFEGTKPEKLDRIADALGEHPREDGSLGGKNRASASARRLLARTGLPARLRDLDLTLDDLSAASDSAGDFDMIRFVPLPVSRQELFDILKQAY